MVTEVHKVHIHTTHTMSLSGHRVMDSSLQYVLAIFSLSTVVTVMAHYNAFIAVIML